MSRSVFGWSLPPGCTQRHIDEAFGDDEQCEVCGRCCSDCICLECPVCGEQGNPHCYEENEGMADNGHHNLTYSKDQLIGQAKARIDALQQKIAEESQYLAYLEQMD